MRTLLTISLLFAWCGPPLGHSTPLLVQEREDPRFDPAATQEFGAHLARIRDEIAKAGTGGWAGRYYMGNGLDVNVEVELAPKSGFAFTWHGCLGLDDRNCGTMTEKEGGLELAFHCPSAQEGNRGLASELIPVKWGERRYLIARDELLSFDNSVNSGSEPRGGTLARPIHEASSETSRMAADAAICDREQRRRPLCRSSRPRREQSAALHFQVDESVGAEGTVVELAAHTARIRIRDLFGEEAPVPKPGWKWSTRY